MKNFLELNAKEFSDLLVKIRACEEAKEWATGKTASEVIETCYRGDWLLWLYKKLMPEDLQTLTLAKGHCANTVRHLMTDERSKNAVDAAIKFGNGEITRGELNAAADAAADAAYAAYDADAYAAAADAADAAYAAADAYAYAYAAAADAAYAAYAADAATRTQNRLLTANICRQYLKFSTVIIEMP